MSKDTIIESSKLVAENIVEMTGYGMALHVNDILPDLKDLATRAYEAGRKEREEEIRQLATTYKTYFNPIGDERNAGKHDAMNDLLTHLTPPTPEERTSDLPPNE